MTLIGHVLFFVALVIVGVLGNIFNLIFTIQQQVKTRSIQTVGLILNVISINNIILVLATFAMVMGVFQNPQIWCIRPYPLIVRTEIYLMLGCSFISFWAIAWLSLFYCIKVVNFSSECFRALKRIHLLCDQRCSAAELCVVLLVVLSYVSRSTLRIQWKKMTMWMTSPTWPVHSPPHYTDERKRICCCLYFSSSARFLWWSCCPPLSGWSSIYVPTRWLSRRTRPRCRDLTRTSWCARSPSPWWEFICPLCVSWLCL